MKSSEMWINDLFRSILLNESEYQTFIEIIII